MEIMEALRGRQSVKSYLPASVEPEKMERVLEVGRLAPSAFNHQYRRFVVVTDPAVKKMIREKAGTRPMIEQAPVVIVLCATEENEFVMPYYPIDPALCGAYMVLEAYELGLGACWLGAFDAEAVKDILSVPEEAWVVTMLPLGYLDGTQERKSRKALNGIVGRDRY